jgi:hypothetical protein
VSISQPRTGVVAGRLPDALIQLEKWADELDGAGWDHSKITDGSMNAGRQSETAPPQRGREDAPRYGQQLLSASPGQIALVEEWTTGTSDRVDLSGVYLVLHGTALAVYGRSGRVDYLRPEKWINGGASVEPCTLTITAPLRIVRVLPAD